MAQHPSEAELTINPGDTAAAIARQVRALRPWPGARIGDLVVDRVAAIRADDPGPPGMLGRDGDTLTLWAASGEVKLVVRWG